MTALWSAECNGSDKISGFEDEIAKEEPSKGSFADDYSSFAEVHSVTPCPFVTASGNRCRVANTVIDLPSWRVMLLALRVQGSQVTELVVHGCELTRQHIVDLCTCIEKIGHLSVCKLDYVTISVPSGDAEAEEGKEVNAENPFLPLLRGIPVDFLSLKGNNLGVLCLSEEFRTALSANLSLRALTLADNKLDDLACARVIEAVKISPFITQVSLAQNECNGEFLTTALQGLLLGSEVSPEDNAAFKNIAKLVGDKNKTIKDVNKARKKAGQAELTELVPPIERDEAGFMSNRSVTVIDLSFCPLSTGAYDLFAAALSDTDNHKAVAQELKLTLILRGRAGDAEKKRVGSADAAEPVPLLGGVTTVW